MTDVRETTSRGAKGAPRRPLGREPRRREALPLAAGALAAALLLAACGGGGGTAETEPDVNPVEALMALDDVRVAGVTLGPAAPSEVSPPAPDALDPAAAAAAPATVSAPRPAASPGTAAAEAPSPAGGATPASAARGADPAAPRPLAVLQPGAPLVVDLEVTNATVGSEVGVVWYAPDGREAWRQKQAVGDAPRLAFSADTRRWPAGVYRGELHYGRVPVHRFAVQVGTPAVRANLAGGPADALRPGGVSGDPLAVRGVPPAGTPVTAGAEAAIAGLPAAAPAAGDSGRLVAEPAVPAAPPRAAPAEAAPAARLPVEVLPVDEGAPVERIPPDDPNAVAPEGPPDPPPEPADDDDSADEPPPAGGA